MRRVAVTGLGVISPLGNTPQALFANLAQGRSGIVKLPMPMLAHAAHSPSAHRMSHVGGRVEFDAAGAFTAQRLRMLDRVSQFALAAAAQAVGDADIDFETCDGQRAGVFVGTGMGGARPPTRAISRSTAQAASVSNPIVY